MALSISIYRGNTETRTITVTSSGVAFDMTGYKMKFIVKASFNDADSAAIYNKEVVFSAPATGIGVLTFVHDDTDINPGSYHAEIKLYKADGTFIKTLEIGDFIISPVVLKEV